MSARVSLPAAIAELPARTPEWGALLEKWANINSGLNHSAGLERMRAMLRTDFGRCLPKAAIDEIPVEAPGCPPGIQCLRLRMRPQAPRQVLLCGHYDTVYEADDSFQTCRWVTPTQLNGPGTADMKGGIVTLLAALQAFESTPGAEGLGWEVLLTPDEESGSRGSADLLRAAAARHHVGLVFEPARPNGDIVKSRKGTGGLRVTCHGRSAHAAKLPNDGRNAVLALAEFVLAASRLPRDLPGVLVNVGNIRGGTAATNVVPDFATSELDLRVTRAADAALLLQSLQRLADEINARDGYRLELSGGMNRPPKECLPFEETLFAAWQRAAADVGMPPFSWVHTAGASDGNLLGAAGLPTLDGLGPLGDFLHSPREYCRVDTIGPRAQIAALVLHRIATGELSLQR